MTGTDTAKMALLQEIDKCRACRFCVHVCPTYLASDGVATLSSYGRLQTLKYLLLGMLDLDDSMTYSFYSCLMCKRCEVICKSKGQDLAICKTLQLGRTLLSRCLVEERRDGKV